MAKRRKTVTERQLEAKLVEVEERFDTVEAYNDSLLDNIESLEREIQFLKGQRDVYERIVEVRPLARQRVIQERHMEKIRDKLVTQNGCDEQSAG